MELVFLYLVFLTLITIGWILNYTGTPKPKTRVLPPGPHSGLIPWFGESIEFLSKWRKGRSEEFVVERVAKLASPEIFRASLLGDTFAVFCGAAGSKFLLSTAGPLVKSWWPKPLHRLFAQTLQDSHKLKALGLLFTSGPSDLHRFVPIMDSFAKFHLASRHWNPVAHHKVVKVYPLAKNYTFGLACRIFMSIEDPEVVERLEAPMNDLASGFMAIPIAFPGTRFHRAIKAAKSMKKQLAEIAKERRLLTSDQYSMSTSTSANDNQDFLQLLLPNLSDMEIADRIMGLLVASHDTSTVVIAFIFKYLSDYPQVYQLVLEENMEVAAKKREGELLNWEDVEKLNYSWNVAREAMRIWTPAPAIFREAAQDFTYGGYHIPKGWKLYMNLSSIHKNPEYYAEPEKFDPRRFEGEGPLPNTYLPFGGGSNMCPGRNFARLQILIFLHNVVRRFHWEMVFPNEEIILNPVARFTQGLPIRLRPATSTAP